MSQVTCRIRLKIKVAEIIFLAKNSGIHFAPLLKKFEPCFSGKHLNAYELKEAISLFLKAIDKADE